MKTKVRKPRPAAASPVSALPAGTPAGPDFHTPLTGTQIRKNRALADDAAFLAPYAIMCNNAYARDHFIPLPAGWKEVTELRHELPAVGMAYTVFEKREDGKLVEVVAAFRGTDDRKDWIQNLIPFFRIQLPPARKAFEQILKRYAGQPVKISATGHSLGGGVAFHLSFVYPDVDAIAFNSSPVTKAGMKIQKGNRRISAWESGEILQIVRNPVNWLRLRWHGVQRLEFRFKHGFCWNQHGMEAFALNLAKLGALKSNQLKALTAGW